jgi:hypothetical protein
MTFAIFALAVSACGPSGGSTSRLELVGSDPSSTDELNAGGGGYVMPVEPAELPHLSDLVVVAEIVDILPPVPNTANGDSPMILPSHAAEDLFNIAPITPISIRINEVLGIRATSAVRPEPGSLLTLHLPGGTLTFNMTLEQIRSLGMNVPDEDFEMAEDGRLKMMTGTALPVSLKEGETAILFLVSSPIPLVSADDLRKPGGSLDAIQIVHGAYGVFQVESPDQVPDQLRVLGAEVDRVGEPSG